MIRLLIFLLAAGFGDTRNPSIASLPIWLLFGVRSGIVEPTHATFSSISTQPLSKMTGPRAEACSAVAV